MITNLHVVLKAVIVPILSVSWLVFSPYSIVVISKIKYYPYTELDLNYRISADGPLPWIRYKIVM